MTINRISKASSSRRGFLQKIGTIASVSLFGSQLSFATPSVVRKKKNLKVLSCNIRVDLPEDEEKGVGWRQRKAACVEILKRQGADVICFQEVLRNQFLDLKQSMSGYYAFGFDGPEMDKYSSGYHGIAKNPIFFSKDRFDILNAGGYWLSETPLLAGSISWGSARARNASWVRLLDKYTNQELRIVNLHLDHVKDEAKIEQIKLVLEECKQYQDDFVQILTGDFNSAPNSFVVKEVLAGGWKDSFSVNNIIGKIEGTTHAFKPYDKERASKANKIDYIFYNGPVQSVSSRIIKDHINEVYPSDHYFLEAILAF